MLFDSIKFRLHGVKTGRVPSCFHFRFFYKDKYKNKCGGDLSKAQGANSLEISPPTCRTTPTDQLQATCPRQDLAGQLKGRPGPQGPPNS